MKMRVYLSLGALLLFLTPLGCSGKAENPAPETPPEEQPKPGPEEPKPEFVDANRSMEETMHLEDDECFYTYFRMQNATKHSVVFFITTRISSYSGVARINPGEQATWLQTMTYLPWIDDNDMVIKDLKALAFVELFFDPPHSSERWVDDELDPCARYSFFDPMTETQHAARPVGVGARRIPRPPECRTLDLPDYGRRIRGGRASDARTLGRPGRGREGMCMKQGQKHMFLPCYCFSARPDYASFRKTYSSNHSGTLSSNTDKEPLSASYSASIRHCAALLSKK